MKVFGHPIHIMLIHFPSALFPMDLICSFIAYYFGILSFAEASFYAMTGGVLLGFMAVITGFADLISTAEKRPDLVRKILVHGGINTLVIIVYSILAFIAYKHYPELTPDRPALLITKAGLILLMIIGNYLGGNLILKDKIGIENSGTF